MCGQWSPPAHPTTFAFVGSPKQRLVFSGPLTMGSFPFSIVNCCSSPPGCFFPCLFTATSPTVVPPFGSAFVLCYGLSSPRIPHEPQTSFFQFFSRGDRLSHTSCLRLPPCGHAYFCSLVPNFWCFFPSSFASTSPIFCCVFSPT